MTNWSVILGIAKTHLLTKIKQTSIAALGVTFGIGSYITLVCFMTGLNAMLDNLILNQTPHIHVYNEIEPSKNQPISFYNSVAESFNVVHSIKPKRTQKKIHNALPIISYLEENKDVRGALPQVKTQIFYIAGSIELGGNLTGINPVSEARLFNMSDYIVEGSAEALEHTDNSILLGIGIAKKMSLKVGDRVQVSPINGGIFPLKIVGFYQSGIADLDAIQSFTNIKTVQRILGEANNYITDINIKLYNIERAVPLAKKIEQQFKLTAIDIKTANAQFETGSSIRSLISYAVGITLLVVSGFGIYNILNMMIYEKLDTIAILKAIGFNSSDVKRIFISIALTIGILGGAIGLILGYVTCLGIDQVPFETEALPTVKTFPVDYNPKYYSIGGIFSVITTYLAGYFPARKASGVDPVDIIRGK